MYNYKLILEYDGSRYEGWQRLGKDESSNTIENKIIEVIKKMTSEDIEIFCGSRTEKGAHASCQTVNFKLNSKHKAHEIKNYLNRYLPMDIAVLEVSEAEERFHSQLNAKNRTYVYYLDTKDVADVFKRKYMYHLFQKPDIKAMEKASAYLLGKHDFKVFSAAKKSKSTEKVIESIVIKDFGDYVSITVTANDFLHNMMRLIVGLLLDVGSGLKKPETVQDMLAGKDIPMSPPAESLGLFLKNIQY